MRYFKDETGRVWRCHWTADSSGSAYGLHGFVDADTGKDVNVEGMQELWTVQDAATEWKRSVQHVHRIIRKAQGAFKIISGSNCIWLMPIGTTLPTRGKPGRPPKAR